MKKYNPNETQPENCKWTKVVIPQELIEKLKPYGPHFIKIAKPILGDHKSGKAAFEPKFYDHPYEADDPELQAWLNEGGNYGVLCGGSVAEADMDVEALQDKWEAQVNTFTVQSGRTSSVGKHALFLTDAIENGTINREPDEEGKQVNLGNIQINHKFVVAPNCNHFSGNKYTVVRNVPLAFVSKKKLQEIFGKQLEWAGQRRKKSVNEAKTESKLTDNAIPIAELIQNFNELTQISATEFQGEHPIHGSETGQNFTVDTAKNCWYCFRCNSGGGPLLWLAVREKLITCAEAKPGALKGPLFKQVLEIAQKLGYKLDFGGVSKYFEGTPPHFVPAYLADELMQKYHYITRKADKTIFRYDKETGIYIQDGETQILTEIVKALGKYLTKARQAEVINYIISSTLRDVEEAPLNLILVGNGILDVNTGELEPFSSDYFFVNAIPTKYVKGAVSQLWLKFISEVMDPQDALVAQEYVGFILYRYYLLERLLMLTGSGANGKSVFLSTITEMLGRKNITSISMVEIETSSFSRSNLYGKLANIFDDLPATALKTTGYLKQVTGRSLISAERKFHDMFNFINYAKLIFACNAVPKCPDDTDAFFRRWLQINFPKVFLENDPKTDKDLTTKLTKPEELSGILNWAIEGLLRLLKNKHFSTGKSIEETREQYIRSTDPVKAFGMDTIIPEPGNLVKKDTVYREFLLYCKQHQLPTVSSRTFSNSFQEALPDIPIQTDYKFENNARISYWRDIALSSTNNETDNFDNSDNCHIPVAKLKSENNSEITILQNKQKGSVESSELSDLSAFMNDNERDETKNGGK